MNIDKQIDLIIDTALADKKLSPVPYRLKIKQSILKAIMEAKPEIMMDISNDYEEGQKYAIEEFESVIKEILK